jgi:hypothetical protein
MHFRNDVGWKQTVVQKPSLPTWPNCEGFWSNALNKVALHDTMNGQGESKEQVHKGLPARPSDDIDTCAGLSYGTGKDLQDGHSLHEGRLIPLVSGCFFEKEKKACLLKKEILIKDGFEASKGPVYQP